VNHQRHVHVVELSQPYQFRLAAEKLDLALAGEVKAILYLHVLLRRHGEEKDAAGEVRQHARAYKAHPGAYHRGELQVVAAGVGGASHRVGKWVLGDENRVKLSKEGDVRARRGRVETGLYAGKRKATPILQIEISKGSLYPGGRPGLSEAEFRMIQKVVC